MVQNMRLQILSDLHLEFLETSVRMIEWIDRLDASGVDVLVLAGDIVGHSHLALVLDHFSHKYSDSEIVYCYGNHEFYGARFDDKPLAQSDLPHNLHVLDKNVVEISGQRFIGAALWFPLKVEAQAHRYRLSDFSTIRGFDPAVYDENEATARFFADEMQPGDVVVTHHYPCKLSTSKEWENDPTNAFFYSPLDDLIEERKPKFWVHGHTHDSFDYRFGETRIVCNPLGYPERQENPNFSARLIIDL